MNSNHDYIAVFDSGVGGISVLRHLRRELPNERFVYYGDSANAPYGTRPTEQIRQLTLCAAKKLMDRGCKALVVACNTATAAAIDTLRATYPDLIVVGIEPAVKLAAQQFPQGRIGVMATPVTLREEKFRHLVEKVASHCDIVTLPAPGLPELVEQGKANSPESRALLEQILNPWRGKLDAVVLGCTHYPFAEATIQAILGEETKLLDGGEGTARETKRRLREAGLLLEGQGRILWENSARDPQLTQLCNTLLTQK
jgi:glutamate racemase